MTTRKTSEEVRTYLIRTRSEGYLKIDVPESWKVTFGPVSPGAKYGSGELALRLYESDTKQRAIFTDVVSFRDMSIPVLKRITAKQSQTKAASDGKGKSEFSAVEEKQSDWVTADEVGF